MPEKHKHTGIEHPPPKARNASPHPAKRESAALSPGMREASKAAKEVSAVEFENRVRATAALIWNRPAKQETINHINYDAVIISSQRWILLEATISTDLEKIRGDLNRLAITRLQLFSNRSIACEVYLVLQSEPTPSMIGTAKSVNIDVLSLSQLRSKLFDFESYQTQRSTHPFGSAVTPESGVADTSLYVPVTYTSTTGNAEYSVERLRSELIHKAKIVLVGEYGTGKSRCLQETFHQLSSAADSSFFYPIAINLRECWGLETADEILSRHFRRLGLSQMADSVIKVIGTGSIILLLDGYDELGVQTWSNELARLKEVRHRALRGVRDLVQQSKGGVLIVGREHYFDGTEEMLRAIGFGGSAKVIRCKSEFSVPEMKAYLSTRGIQQQPPEWLPRRPLMVQILASFDQSTLNDVLAAATGAVRFWHLFVEGFCKREAGAQESVLDPFSVRRIMQALARLTRTKQSDVGPLTQTEIRRAFELVLGTTAIDESRVVLQRLSGLGRVSMETDDRQFVDPYLLDGFRALDVGHIVEVEDRMAQQENWINPLKGLGQLILGERAKSSSQQFLQFAKHCSSNGNAVLGGDIVASLATTTVGAMDFGGLQLQTSYLHELNLLGTIPSNLILNGCLVHRLVAPRNTGPNFLIDDCDIGVFFGESRRARNYLKNCRIDHRQIVSVPLERLAIGQRVLTEVLTLVWAQRGKSVVAAAIRRRGAKIAPDHVVSRILEILVNEEEILLQPTTKRRAGKSTVKINREARRRVADLLRDTYLSEDPLWKKAGNVK